MLPLFKIAVRNVFRNKKRSLITLSAVAFGLGALIFLRSFIYGAQSQMVGNITSTLTSDAQIVPKALENIYNTNDVIENPEAIRKILREDRRVLGFAERVVAGGLINSATNSMVTFVVGINPDQENFVGSRRNIVKGRSLTREDSEGAAIGEKMRQVLGLEIGDKIVVTGQDYYGSLAGAAFRLVGTFETGNDQIDNGTVMLLMPAAQKMLSLDQKISKFALRIDPRANVNRVVEDVRTKISNDRLKVLTWEELIPMLAQLIRFQNGMLVTVVLVVLTVVAAGILNTLMMSIVERVREFGLMMALGTKPSQIVMLVVTESFLLTTVGAAIGTLFGVSVSLYFAYRGIDLSRFVSTLSNFLIGSHVYPKIDWIYLIFFILVVLVSNIIVSFYPAWRAGKLIPIDAMRQVG